jgi:predicted ATPase/DNA-binding SARP family transcriptional activator
LAHTLWYFELLGRFRAESHARSLERFRTQKTASLLAYLVLHADKPHSRESLIDLFWPDSTPEAGQTNLRVSLNSLRKQLEPPGFLANSLLIATRETVKIAAHAIDTDVARFEIAVRAAQGAPDEADQCTYWAEAISLYRGRLLPSLYDEWILRDQAHLETLYSTALRRIIGICERKGDVGTALEFALRAVASDPLNEDIHTDALRLYIAAGQPNAAVRHFRQLESTLREQIDAVPSCANYALVAPWIGSDAAVASRPKQAVPFSVVPTASSPAAVVPDFKKSLLNPALPAFSGNLYGRDEDCRWLLAKLRSKSTMLLTLTGPGGVGKTRLAAELSHQMAEQLHEKLAFVSLADITDAEMIPFAILHAFHLHVPKQIEPVQAMAEFLEGAPVLLVLDNFEQLMPAGIEEIRILRNRIPNLTLLITSRHVLGLEGEQTFAVLPLPLPSDTTRQGTYPATVQKRSLLNCDALLQNAGIQLFIERAQALRADFQITSRNAADLAKICTYLEGMPLAIELAASWVNVLTPSQMLKRFQFPVCTLGSRRRDISPRHRTVQDTVAWSYRLLSPALQQHLRILSIFRGGWTLEALTAITGTWEGKETAESEDRTSEDFVEILAELQERSLIFAHEEKSGGEIRMRYRMLESVREFCFDLMSPEEMQVGRQRHADFFFAFSQLARQDYDTERQAHAVSSLSADYENVLAAMDWLLNSNATDASRNALQVANNLYGMWSLRGMNSEGKHYLDRALAHTSNRTPCAERATALNAVARLYSEFGDNERALTCMYEGLAIRREIGRDGVIGSSLNSIGGVLQLLGRWEEAFESYQQAAELFRRDGRISHVAIALRNMGLVCMAQGDFDGVDRYVRESLEICRRERFTHGIYAALGTLANLAYLAGRLAQARDRYEECRDFFQETEDVSGLAATLSNLGRLYHDLDEKSKSIEALSEAFVLTQKIGDKHEIILLFEHAAHVCSVAHPLVASNLCGAAQAGRNAIDTPRSENDQASHSQFLDSLRVRSGDSDFHAAFNAGLTMDPDLVIDFALTSLAAS